MCCVAAPRFAFAFTHSSSLLDCDESVSQSMPIAALESPCPSGTEDSSELQSMDPNSCRDDPLSLDESLPQSMPFTTRDASRILPSSDRPEPPSMPFNTRRCSEPSSCSSLSLNESSVAQSTSKSSAIPAPEPTPCPEPEPLFGPLLYCGTLDRAARRFASFLSCFVASLASKSCISSANFSTSRRTRTTWRPGAQE